MLIPRRRFADGHLNEKRLGEMKDGLMKRILMNRILHWLPVGIGVAMLIALAYLQRERALRGENDFAQFYTAAKLAGTSDLYSRATNLAVVKAQLGFTMQSVVYTRPPFYAAILKPLAWLPYRAAYAMFSLVTFGCVLWFVIRFSKECSALPFFAAMSIPILAALCGGQDTPFLLAILGASIVLAREKRDFAAGMVLALVAIKFHLFLFVPVMLIMKKRWRMAGGGLAATLLLTIVGVLVNGAGSIVRYIDVLRDPWINPSATIMPNLHGLVAILHGGRTLEIGLIAAVACLFLWALLRTDNFEFLLAVSLVASLLASFHSGIADDILLLPVFVAVIRTCSAPFARTVAGLILTPVPYFMTLADAPYSAALPIVLIIFLAYFVRWPERYRLPDHAGASAPRAPTR